MLNSPHLFQDVFARTLDDSLKISRQCFSQDYRLRKSFEFKRIKHHGMKHKAHAFWMQVLCDVDSSKPKLGIIVTRKFGNAVFRNRAKRIFREIFRKNLHNIPTNYQIIILPRKMMHSFPFNRLESSFMLALAKFSEKL